MEWTGQQQMLFFLQSICLGAPVGLMLDIITGLADPRSGYQQLMRDVLLGPLSALFVFLGALSIMDGHLHPLLIFGSFVGMIAERLSLGLLIRKVAKHLRRFAQKCKSFLGR